MSVFTQRTFFEDDNGNHSFGGSTADGRAVTPLFNDDDGDGLGTQVVSVSGGINLTQLNGSAISPSNPLPIINTINGANSAFDNRLFVASVPYDYSKKSASNTIFGESLTAQRNPYILENFQYTISPINFVTGWVNSATGYVASNESQVTLQTGTTPNSSGFLMTRRPVRYVSGSEVCFMFTAEFTSGGIGTSGIIGGFSGTDGVYVGFVDGEFCFAYQDSVHSTEEITRVVTQSDFNIDKLDGSGNSGFALNTSKNNLYRITYGWLGVASIYLDVFAGSEVGWVLAHVFDFANIVNGVHIGNPVVPMRAFVSNGNTNTNVKIKSGSWHGSNATQNDVSLSQDRYFTETQLDKNVSGNTLTNLITLSVPTTYYGKTNTISLSMNFLSIAVVGNQSTDIRIYKNATVASAAYTAYDVTNSVTNKYVGNTLVTNGQLLFSTLVGANLSEKVYLNELAIYLYPGETITVCVISTTSKVVDISLRWRELF